ncbi:MAG: MFS transporter [Novosphingobium sp. 17-62-19]|uniref:MFS transporter n=1 Tax=Novosphingobium sp. 17-62-19 TaxID=1970406 RepID=UPI000BD07A19|nr:MFS transporter [Novosphingobium sp. 17-62-19]OZA17029.1 MAG: MFS transporter [Novosphingobium sp. 17-62-19]HQS97567.1 MFS transporter [Novosphingobium sp.]
MNAAEAEPRPPITIAVTEVIERQKLNAFVIRLVLISWTVTFLDGLDMLVISFVAPYLRDGFGADAISLGQLFAAGVFGAMLGGIGFGWLGDRFGRRPIIIASVATFGLTGMAIAAAGNMDQLLVLRFLNGVALGGLMPLIWALNIEFVPARYRASVVTVIMMGYTLGGVVAGPLTVWLAPHFGWQSVFIVAGAATLALVPILFAILPESARYLAVTGRSPEKVAKALNTLEPGLGAQVHDRFVVTDEGSDAPAQKFHIATLFKGDLRPITSFLWLAYIGSSMAVYFKSNWGPIIFEDVGFTRTDAAWIMSASSVLGLFAGLALMRFTDRLGPIAITIYPALAVPLLLLMGLADVSLQGLAIFSLCSMAMISGTHFGMHSIAGIFYPSAIRGNGAGWATSVAKIGSIFAPLLGGYLLATNLPPRHLFVLLAVTPLLSAISLFLLGRIHARRVAVPVPSHPADPAVLMAGPLTTKP